MKRVRSAVAAVMLAGCAHVSTNPAASLADAERAFASDAVARTVNDAFLAVFAPDATLFQPLPIDGGKALADRPFRATLDLRWTPVYAEASADGTLGFTTGPATIGQRGQPVQAATSFVSVWKRSGGIWRLRTDAGAELPQQLSLDSAARTLSTRNLTHRYATSPDMLKAELALIADYQKQFAMMADTDVRVYRGGAMPTTTRASAVELVSRDSAADYKPAVGEVAGSGDLGFVYGVITLRQSKRPGSYERIYRRDKAGQWRIAVDWRD